MKRNIKIILPIFALMMTACNFIRTPVDLNGVENNDIVAESNVYEHGIGIEVIKKSNSNSNTDYYASTTLSYTVYPSDAQNKRISTKVVFDDNRSASDYLEITVDETNQQITIGALQGFDSLARLTIRSVENTNAYAVVTIHMNRQLVIDYNDDYNYKMGGLVKKCRDNDCNVTFGSSMSMANVSDVYKVGYYGVNTENQIDESLIASYTFSSMTPVTGYSETDCIVDVNFSSIGESSDNQVYIKQRLYNAVKDWFTNQPRYDASSYPGAYGFGVDNTYLSEYVHYYLDFPDLLTGPRNVLANCFTNDEITFTVQHLNLTFSTSRSIYNNQTINSYDLLGDTFDVYFTMSNKAIRVSSVSSDTDVYL